MLSFVLIKFRVFSRWVCRNGTSVGRYWKHAPGSKASIQVGSNWQRVLDHGRFASQWSGLGQLSGKQDSPRFSLVTRIKGHAHSARDLSIPLFSNWTQFYVAIKCNFDRNGDCWTREEAGFKAPPQFITVNENFACQGAINSNHIPIGEAAEVLSLATSSGFIICKRECFVYRKNTLASLTARSLMTRTGRSNCLPLGRIMTKF